MRNICHNIYASLNGKYTKVIKYVFVCESCNTFFFVVVVVVLFLSCCFYRINVFFTSMLMLLLFAIVVCWHSLQPKVIFDYRSLHRVKGKKENIIQTMEVWCVYIYTLLSRKLRQTKPNQVCARV